MSSADDNSFRNTPDEVYIIHELKNNNSRDETDRDIFSNSPQTVEGISIVTDRNGVGEEEEEEEEEEQNMRSPRSNLEDANSLQTEYVPRSDITAIKQKMEKMSETEKKKKKKKKSTLR
eukprot:TRINITY_DN784_c0_g1_i1.p2 TRINITY_DN784_c0_g1~~TRINITY_DN784_c0_g1_i1.p2  ORF type:complete len:119 (-),score=31.43 TRINITY_DN784_c0_g1_i1:5-361(-)